MPSEERRRVLLGAAPGTPNSSSVAMHTANFVIRVLKSWARLVATHQVFKLPPFIHRLQLSGDSSTPAPLANCFTLVKMWSEHTQGSMGLVESTVLLEIQRLLREYVSYNETELLAGLQSLLLLLTILLFGLNRTGSDKAQTIEAELIVKVWDVKSSVAGTGILLDEEQSHVLPTWREWALVSAKRRTIQALHHLEWAWSLVRGYPVLTCFELGPLPAPTAGYLWNENEELQWKQSYTRWLDVWKIGGGYKLGELFNIDPGDDLNSRTEMWLAEVDEFGMVLMAELNSIDA
ncbi:unnamed protein product [Clonostachys rhizophaga]|uniref:Uncharacterized protein n=1 Tax=Clonostachys rhizophaga TaxID=160324 RepID=A0A9N9YKV2_9HYPO|nr:unnamed protein product [Clonostachys rhizophaga]